MMILHCLIETTAIFTCIVFIFIIPTFTRQMTLQLKRMKRCGRRLVRQPVQKHFSNLKSKYVPIRACASYVDNTAQTTIVDCHLIL